MSVYKVIGNTYIELLDYIHTSVIKYGDINTYMEKMTRSEQRQLFDRIATVYQRIDILRKSQENYYKAKETNAIFFICLLVFLILLNLVGMAYMFKVQINQDDDKTLRHLAKVFIMYLIFCIFIFTILFLLMFNIIIGMGRNNAIRLETMENISRLEKIMDFVEKKPIVDMSAYQTESKPVKMQSLKPVLLFASYKSTESRSAYNSIWKKNYDILKDYVSSAEGANTTLSSSNIFLYDKFIENNKETLLVNITDFYDNGGGYLTLRKHLIEYSNPQLIKEVRAVLRYYYAIMKKDDTVDSVEVIEAQKQNIVESRIIKEFKSLENIARFSSDKYYTSPNKAPSGVDTAGEIIKAKNNSEFMKYYEKFQILCVLLLFYCIPLWSKQNYFWVDMKGRQPDNMSMYGHANRLTSTLDKYNNSYYKKPNKPDTPYTEYIIEKHNSFKTSLLTKFQKFDTRYSQIVETAIKKEDETKPEYLNSNMKMNCDSITYYVNPSFDQCITEVLVYFKKEFDECLTGMLSNIRTDYLFPFDAQYMVRNIQSAEQEIFWDTDIISCTNYFTEFFNKVKHLHYDRVIDEFKQSQDLKPKLTQNISPIVQKMNIKLSDYSNIILGKLKQDNPDMKPEIVNTIQEIIHAVDLDVVQKSMVEDAVTVGKKSTNVRFMEIDKFVAKIDAMSFQDLKVGLNYAWFKDIINVFYMSVTNQEKTSKTKDISFQQRKTQKLALIWAICVSLMIILVSLYQLIVTFEEYQKVKDINVNANNSAKQFMLWDMKVNIFFKGIIVFVATVFVISLLWSSLKKAQAKTEYNRDTIETNTSSLRRSVNDLYDLLSSLDNKIQDAEKAKRISDITQFSFDDKSFLYDKIKDVLLRSEKCNYLLAIQQGELPFPYTEVTIDGFMVLVCILCIVFVIAKINPIEKLSMIKTLYKLKERGQYLDNDNDFKEQIRFKAKCHDNDIESVIFTIKILFFLFIVTFLIFYSGKVLQSTSEYQNGLYNSYYYEESLCV